MGLTIAILVIAAAFFVSGKVRSDIVALCSLIALLVFQILTPDEALSGFFADRIDVNHWFLLSGILIICIAIVCPMITEIRKLDAK